MAGESKGMKVLSLGAEQGGGKQLQRGLARVKPEEGDDRWGPPVS
jgi:hypothetical protein